MGNSSAPILLLALAVTSCGSSDGGNTADESAQGVSLHVLGSSETFQHSDTLSGITPLSASGGVRSFSLLLADGDPNPLVLFDGSESTVEVRYDSGADTRLAVVDPASFRTGRYTLARLVQAYSRYEIDATHHASGTSTPGTLQSLQVMSDRTLVDGVQRDAGFYCFSFVTPPGPGETSGTDEGVCGLDYPVPTFSSTAGAWAVVEEGDWVVYFPVDLQIDELPEKGTRLDLTVNMFESFRWIDANDPGYEDGVFDFLFAGTEPFAGAEILIRFGGNQFDLAWR